MSRIEKALEKAVRSRESGTGGESLKPDISGSAEARINNNYIVTVTRPESPAAEEYRRLKSMLIKQTKSAFLNTIMITSSVNGEGKTLTAVNLAVTLSQEIDHSTLLIDADFRNPMTHEYLGIEYESGLSDYLRGGIDISEVLIKTGIGNMVLLPAGSAVKNPVELLSSKRMKALIKELKQRYADRYIIVDTPPVLSCTEAIAVGSFVDGVVFVVREGRTGIKTVEDALNMMEGFNILGVVFNNASISNLDGDYSYYHYKYKKKGKE